MRACVCHFLFVILQPKYNIKSDMKRKSYIVLLCICLINTIVYANNDIHLSQLVQCINDNDLVCASEQLPLVKNWEYGYEEELPMDIDKALQFVKYANSRMMPRSVTDPLKLYIGRACYEEGYSKKAPKEAIRYYEASVRLLRDVQKKNELEFAEILESLGASYVDTGNAKKAETVYLEARNIRKKNLPRMAEDYALSLMLLGNFYLENKNYQKAETYLLECLQVSKEYVSEDFYLDALAEVADFYEETGNSKKAKYYESLLEKADNDDEDDFLNYAFGKKKKSYSYADYLKYQQSVIDATLDFRSQNEENSAFYAMFTALLGVNYWYMGEYKRSEENLLAAVEMYKTMEQDSLAHSMYTMSIATLGVLYMNLGDYDKAEQYFLEVDSTIPLGLLYGEKKEYKKAEQYLLKALAESEERFGVNSAEYANCSNHLGRLYLNMHEYEEARKHLMDAYYFYKDNLRDDDNNVFLYTYCLKNLGELYLYLQEYEKAESVLLTVLKVQNYIHDESHPDYIACLNSLGELYFQAHTYERTEPFFVRARNGQKKTFIHSVDFMSDTQRSRYWAMVQDRYERQYPNFCYRYQSQKPSISTFAYDNELYTKGLLLSSSNAIRQSILESGDSALIQDWEQVMNLRNQIRAMQEKGNMSDSLMMIEKFAEEREKEVVKSSAAYRENIRQWSLTWDSVRAVLKPNEVAIEYMRAPLNEDSTMYCALLVRDTCSYPIMIPLFEEKEVSALMHHSTATKDSAAIRMTYTYHHNGAALTEHVWAKTMPYIKKGETVYFAPTGILHQIAIENLPYDSTQTMTERYHLIRVSSTRELAINRPKIAHERATLYGDIRYGASPEDMAFYHMKYEGMDIAGDVAFAGTYRGNSKIDLPGTKKEIEAIEPILTKKKVQVQVFTSYEANEESVKALSGTKQNILHFATHGFYWQDSTYVDPMDRCGLLFAGSNTALSGHRERIKGEGVQDGILSAKEISLLDFRDADIVVLSACETGLGDISGEGVFGLQRAFKMAGAQTIMMSLWQVSDEATRILMTSFYRNYSKGMSKREAFMRAQQEVRDCTAGKLESASRAMSGKEKMLNKGKMGSSEKPESNGSKSEMKTSKTDKNAKPFASPYYWAGFVLLD